MPKTTYVLSDVHGHLPSLLASLEMIDLAANRGTSLMLLGDYLDRGAQNAEVLSHFNGLARRSNTSAAKANIEARRKTGVRSSESNRDKRLRLCEYASTLWCASSRSDCPRRDTGRRRISRRRGPYGMGDDACYKTKNGYFVWANADSNNVEGLPFLGNM